MSRVEELFYELMAAAVVKARGTTTWPPAKEGSANPLPLANSRRIVFVRYQDEERERECVCFDYTVKYNVNFALEPLTDP